MFWTAIAYILFKNPVAQYAVSAFSLFFLIEIFLYFFFPQITWTYFGKNISSQVSIVLPMAMMYAHRKLTQHQEKLRTLDDQMTGYMLSYFTRSEHATLLDDFNRIVEKSESQRKFNAFMSEYMIIASDALELMYRTPRLFGRKKAFKAFAKFNDDISRHVRDMRFREEISEKEARELLQRITIMREDFFFRFNLLTLSAFSPLSTLLNKLAVSDNIKYAFNSFRREKDTALYLDSMKHFIILDASDFVAHANNYFASLKLFWNDKSISHELKGEIISRIDNISSTFRSRHAYWGAVSSTLNTIFNVLYEREEYRHWINQKIISWGKKVTAPHRSSKDNIVQDSIALMMNVKQYFLDERNAGNLTSGEYERVAYPIGRTIQELQDRAKKKGSAPKESYQLFPTYRQDYPLVAQARIPRSHGQPPLLLYPIKSWISNR